MQGFKEIFIQRGEENKMQAHIHSSQVYARKFIVSESNSDSFPKGTRLEESKHIGIESTLFGVGLLTVLPECFRFYIIEDWYVELFAKSGSLFLINSCLFELLPYADRKKSNISIDMQKGKLYLKKIEFKI